MYILKQLFFSISVNNGRIFTSPLRGSVNILPLSPRLRRIIVNCNKSISYGRRDLLGLQQESPDFDYSPFELQRFLPLEDF